MFTGTISDIIKMTTQTIISLTLTMGLFDIKDPIQQLFVPICLFLQSCSMFLPLAIVITQCQGHPALYQPSVLSLLPGEKYLIIYMCPNSSQLGNYVMSIGLMAL